MENDKYIKPIDFSKRDKVKEIDSDDYYQTAHISNNEKYLAFGGNLRILKIYDLKKDRIIKNFMVRLMLVSSHLIHLNFMFHSGMMKQN